MPANLQGIWNDSLAPSWDSKYTININTEMNYWPAEVTNLSEMHEPLFDLVDNARANGREVAKTHLRRARVRDPPQHRRLGPRRRRSTACDRASGRSAAPGCRCTSGITTTSPRDREFLRVRALSGDEGGGRVLSRLHGRGRAGPADHRAVDVAGERLPDCQTAPRRALTMGPYMDTQIAHALFTRVIAASEILGVDAEFRAPRRRRRARSCRRRRSASTASSRSGSRTTTSGARATGTSRTCSRCIPATRSRRAARRSWRARPASRSSAGWPPAAATPAGAARGSSTSGRGCWKADLAHENLVALLAKSTHAEPVRQPSAVPDRRQLRRDRRGIAEMLLQSHAGEIALLPALPAGLAVRIDPRPARARRGRRGCDLEGRPCHRGPSAA